MAALAINGGDVVYEILGATGDLIVLTPGGRFGKDIPGLRPLAEALVDGGYRVLLWDRPNCGHSDVQFYGQSESHMRAETLHRLLIALGTGPCIIAGGSGGARDSMLAAMLYPEQFTKLVVWNIVGGVPWPEDAWERASELRASGKVARYNGFDTWVLAAPAILEFLGR